MYSILGPKRFPAHLEHRYSSKQEMHVKLQTLQLSDIPSSNIPSLHMQLGRFYLSPLQFEHRLNFSHVLHLKLQSIKLYFIIKI